MREWLRRSRGYLIALPIALVIGFGYDGYNVWKEADLKVDVDQGEQAKIGAATVQFQGVQIKQPSSDDSFSISQVPEGAVVVVAKFRGRIDDRARAKKLKFISCESKIEDDEGWNWKSETLSKPYIPESASTTCTGSRTNKKFKEVNPPEGEWYTFYMGYYVPKERAQKAELYPTLDFYKDPRPLRFRPAG
ncbi:MAG: hypothetical protein GEV07_28125 [Streptosporangiales bacterium]|nr:hypothetical protein [Streptosporangiales bacterium]